MERTQLWFDVKLRRDSTMYTTRQSLLMLWFDVKLRRDSTELKLIIMKN